ncbi:MAG: protein kinase [Planctomycetes bacterium]|nr:protein kinase [Planctomycetota bacterium]
MFHADLHVHSRFSRATSQACNLVDLSVWARRKGLRVLGTGDFTHPGWMGEIRESLVPAETGLFRLRPELEREVEQRLRSELGSGGMASVFLAEVVQPHAGLAVGDTVAVKILHSHLTTEEGFKDRFRREAETGTRIRHGNVVRTLDFGETENGRLYLVLERVEGTTLRDLLNETLRIPEDLCRHFGAEIARALAAVHAEGVIHRDIKPENVLVTKEQAVKVTDLGVACLADAQQRLSATGQFVGSIFYAAPEQIQGGGKDIDARLDLYQFGVLLYELCSGVHPFSAGDPQEAIQRLLTEEPKPLSARNPQVSPFFDELVKKLMARRREERFASAGDVAEALEQGESSSWWEAHRRSLATREGRPLWRIRVPRDTAFVGREEERSALRRLFDLAAGGRGQAVLLTGDAGIGKTRLVREFLEDLSSADLDHQFLYGVYRAAGAGEGGDGLAAAFAEHPGEGIPDLESPESVLAGLRTRAAGRPALLVLEDLHQADASALKSIDGLCGAIGGHRAMILLTARRRLPPWFLAAFENAAHRRHIALPRLTDREIRILLRGATGSDRMARMLHERIADRSDGKPFYVLELLRGLEQAKLLSRTTEGTFVTTREIRALEVPPSVRDLVLGRIAGLTRENRSILEAAACAGFEFDPDLVASSLALEPRMIRRRLLSLDVTTGLVRSSDEGRFAFDDHLLRETILEGIEEAARAEFETGLARALESREAAAGRDPAAAVGEVAVDLCLHWLAAGQGERAGRFLDAAVAALETAWRNAAAAELLGEALAVEGLLGGARRADLLLRRAERLEILGRRKEEEAVLAEAAACAGEAGDLRLVTVARRRKGEHLRRAGDLAAAGEVLEEARELAGRARDRVEDARVAAELAFVRWQEGEVEEATDLAGNALTAAREAGDGALEARVLGILGLIALGRGRFEESLDLHDCAARRAREAGDRRGAAREIAFGAGAMWALGRPGEALAAWERGIGLSRALGDRRAEAWGRLCFGLSGLELGNRRRARESLEEARSGFRETGCRLGEAPALRGLGVLSDMEGRLDEAESLYSESLAICRASGHRAGIAESLLLLGRLHGTLSRAGTAAHELMEAHHTGTRLLAPEIVVMAAVHLARIARGDVDYAQRVLAEHAASLPVRARIEAAFTLSCVTHDPALLSEAKALLEASIAAAPEDARATMQEEIPLYREVLSAGRPPA